MIDKDLTNQEKLEEIYKMTLENHSVLVSLRNQQRLGNIMRAVYWIVIVGAFAGMFYYLSPVLNMFTTNTARVSDTLSGLRSIIPETKALDAILNSMKQPQ